MKREEIEITDTEEFGDFTGDGPWKWEGQTYNKVEKIHRHNCDGECWDMIIQRESDKKYFKFDVWDAGHHNGYIFCNGDNNSGTFEEVFPEQALTVEYK